MTRLFKCLLLTQEACQGMREVIRPFDAQDVHPEGVSFCTRLYMAIYSLESDPDLEAIDFTVNEVDVLIINHFVSAEDGGWANDLLRQTRQVLYELATGKEAVQLTASTDIKKILADVSVDLETDGTLVEVDEEEAGE